MEAQSPRAKLRTWVKERIGVEGPVSVPQITGEAVNRFVKDEEFVRRFLMDELRPVVYDLVRAEVAATRSLGAVSLGDEVVDRAEFEREVGERVVARRKSRWDKRLEHAGKQHFRLKDMGRDELFLAATERFERAGREHRIGEFLMELRESLRSGEKVRDRFTDHQLDELFDREKQLEAV